MRCKACDTEISTVYRTKKRLDPEDMQENFQEEEDLCNECLGVAKESYILYNEDAYGDREENIRNWFYRPVDQIDAEVYDKIISEGSIKTEGD